jgi:hypothetical protein
MLTLQQLVTLHRALRRTPVLSVYIDGSAADPAIQRSWRVQLDRGLADLRRWLEGSSHDERKQFEACAGLLDDAIRGFGGSIRAPGWAAFITADGIQDAQALPAPMPTLAVWSTGPCVAPYIRALKEGRPVVVVLADARKATLFRYRLGKLDLVATVHAHHAIDHPEHMGAAPRAGFHTGTRGRAGHDAAQRSLLTGRDRMLAETVSRASELAGADGSILLGGIKRVVARLAERLGPMAPGRVLELKALDVHASGADVASAARDGASALRNGHDERRIAEIEDAAGAHGLGIVGPADARLALSQGSVRELYVTRRYLEDHAAEAEDAVRAALDQDAVVEEASGAAAERLDSRGGMAAALRFHLVAAEGRELVGAEET